MSFSVLFFDELRGYVKSKVTIGLFIGLPVLSILMTFLTGQIEDFPAIYLVTILATSVAGALGSIMISTSITNEMTKNVFDLFLIRPVKRRNILLAKYIAAYLCLLGAVFVSIIVGLILDKVMGKNYEGPIGEYYLEQTFDSIITVFFALGITCSFGTLFGIVMKSVAGSALLSLYVGNQSSSLLTLVFPMIAQLNELITGVPLPFDPMILSILIGIGVSIGILVLAIVVFNKKQF